MPTPPTPSLPPLRSAQLAQDVPPESKIDVETDTRTIAIMSGTAVRRWCLFVAGPAGALLQLQLQPLKARPAVHHRPAAQVVVLLGIAMAARGGGKGQQQLAGQPAGKGKAPAKEAGAGGKEAGAEKAGGKKAGKKDS
jgi:hypothetical protein